MSSAPQFPLRGAAIKARKALSRAEALVSKKKKEVETAEGVLAQEQEKLRELRDKKARAHERGPRQPSALVGK